MANKLLINDTPFVHSRGLEIDESNPYSLTQPSSIIGYWNIDYLWTNNIRYFGYIEGYEWENAQLIYSSLPPCAANADLMGVSRRLYRQVFCSAAPRDFFLSFSLSPVGDNWGILGRTDPLPPVPSTCILRVNYSNGSQSPPMEFPQCPTVEIIEDEICPSACNLATQILSKLGG